MLESVREYDIPYVLELITPVFREKLLEGLYVKIGTLKLQTLKRSQKCACCGREGSVFKLEVTSQDCACLNLYSADGILMCTDHIIPLSKGGPHRLFNTQTMCEVCNREKSDYIQKWYFNMELKGWMQRKGISFDSTVKKESNGRSR